MKRLKYGILYFSKEIQDYNATTCGWFYIAAIVNSNDFNKFINMFSNNPSIKYR